MPSPFQRMDPYLEGNDRTSFHTHVATEITRQLTPLLRPKYVALPEKRLLRNVSRTRGSKSATRTSAAIVLRSGSLGRGTSPGRKIRSFRDYRG
jgi:hypothetical protein